MRTFYADDDVVTPVVETFGDAAGTYCLYSVTGRAATTVTALLSEGITVKPSRSSVEK